MKSTKPIFYTSLVATIGAAMVGAIGCGEKVADVDARDHPLAAAAGHPTEGPHHGELIELGEEEYHAELVHDEASGKLTVYMLDSSGKTAAPVDAKELRVNLSHDGNAEQFTLAAKPEASDPPGECSRFVSSEAALAEELDQVVGEAQLVVTINHKQFRGAIAHDHAEHRREGHDH